MKKRILRIISIVLIIQMLFMSIANILNYSGLKVYAAHYIKDMDGFTFEYDTENYNLYVYVNFLNGDKVKLMYNRNSEREHYQLTDDDFLVRDMDRNIYGPYNELSDKIGGQPPAIEYSYEDIEGAFVVKIPRQNSEKPEPVPTDPDKVPSDDLAKYYFVGDTLTIQYYDEIKGALVEEGYEYTAKLFTLIDQTHRNDEWCMNRNGNGYNNKRPVRWQIRREELVGLGIAEDEIPEWIRNDKSGGTIGPDVNLFDWIIDGVAGLILYPLKMVPLVIGKVLSWIGSMFVDGSAGVSKTLTLSDILFNEIELTKIDFFNFNSTNNTVKEIRKNVAIWYYGIRNIAAIVLLCILIYVGIRMALSTMAESKAKYKQMLIDWLVGLALLFVLHFIIIFIISINNGLIEILKTPLKDGGGAISDTIMDELWSNGWSIGFTEGVGSAICYMLLVGMTFVFLMSYIKRMITIAFLIVIAPLVTVTYSIDKMGDRKIPSIKCMA